MTKQEFDNLKIGQLIKCDNTIYRILSSFGAWRDGKFRANHIGEKLNGNRVFIDAESYMHIEFITTQDKIKSL